MSLFNKTIRFLDKSGTEQRGYVSQERGPWISVEQKTYLLHEIKILETLPYRYLGVEWFETWANDPVLRIFMTEDRQSTNLALMRYEQKGDDFWAEHKGLVRFFHYPGPGNGYGGRSFTITMKNGSARVLKGPWSGSCREMNKIFPESMPCSIHTEKGRYAGSILVEKARLLIPPHIYLFKDNTGLTSPSLSPEKLMKLT